MIRNLTLKSLRENFFVFFGVNIFAIGYLIAPAVNWETAYKMRYYLGKDPAKQ